MRRCIFLPSRMWRRRSNCVKWWNYAVLKIKCYVVQLKSDQEGTKLSLRSFACLALSFWGSSVPVKKIEEKDVGQPFHCAAMQSNEGNALYCVLQVFGTSSCLDLDIVFLFVNYQCFRHRDVLKRFAYRGLSGFFQHWYKALHSALPSGTTVWPTSAES